MMGLSQPFIVCSRPSKLCLLIPSSTYRSTSRSFSHHHYRESLQSPIIRDWTAIACNRRQTIRSYRAIDSRVALKAASVPMGFAPNEAVLSSQAITSDLVSNLYAPRSPPRDTYSRHKDTESRKCWSEPLPNTHRYGAISALSIIESHSPVDDKASRHQQSEAVAATNDASALKSSCIGGPHHNESLIDNSSQTHFLNLDKAQAKSPAQREWERLWYSGVSAAFSKIACHFPELTSTNPPTSTSLGISEPSLAVSSLPLEDRAIFEKEEQAVNKSSFIPSSEQDRLRRLHRAAQADTETEKLALLLGLPTFHEYHEKKCQDLTQAFQQSFEPSKSQLKREAKQAQKKENRKAAKAIDRKVVGNSDHSHFSSEEPPSTGQTCTQQSTYTSSSSAFSRGVMTHERKSSKEKTPLVPAQHRPLVVGLTKPQGTRSASTMASSSSEAAALNKEIEENVKSNTSEAAPSEDNPTAPTQKPKKEKAPKQPKPQKAAAPVAPTSPALIDLRVGHILRAIAHPNADSLYVSTIAMGDPEGTEHTQVDEETGKIVRTVCSGLNGLVPLEEMQDRKIVVVANLKPVNMRSIKSAAMVLAASPKQPEGADPHAADRVVELVQPPEGSEAGDKVYFEGWPYGEGKGPEKVLNPKKKQWEAIQPGFFTTDDLIVAFDAGSCEEVDGANKGNLVVEGKGACTVKTLKGAVVR